MAALLSGLSVSCRRAPANPTGARSGRRRRLNGWIAPPPPIGLAGEHLAWRQNYMDLDPAYTDKFGDPLLRFTLNWTDHEYKQREFAEQIQARIAREMGGKFDEGPRPRARYNVINYQSTHIQGGAIMGTSPENSVVNRYLQHWDLPNLFVIG